MIARMNFLPVFFAVAASKVVSAVEGCSFFGRNISSSPRAAPPAYGAVQAQLALCGDYVRGWLRYQALWDMKMQQLVDAVGSDAGDAATLGAWAALLREKDL